MSGQERDTGPARSPDAGQARSLRGHRPHVVVVGDVVLDRDVDGVVDRICPDAPAPVLDVSRTRRSPGGAGLTALLCAAAGARVTLVAPLADDDAGRELAGLLGAQVDVVALGHAGPTRRKTRVRSGGQSLVRTKQKLLVLYQVDLHLDYHSEHHKDA